jgi:hypothetical protein
MDFCFSSGCCVLSLLRTGLVVAADSFAAASMRNPRGLLHAYWYEDESELLRCTLLSSPVSIFFFLEIVLLGVKKTSQMFVAKSGRNEWKANNVVAFQQWLLWNSGCIHSIGSSLGRIRNYRRRSSILDRCSRLDNPPFLLSTQIVLRLDNQPFLLSTQSSL